MRLQKSYACAVSGMYSVAVDGSRIECHINEGRNSYEDVPENLFFSGVCRVVRCNFASSASCMYVIKLKRIASDNTGK
jgi:hypothetical protein